MKQPTPAIVAQSAVRRLPRLALWLFCAAYVLPGLFGREPWKGNEFTALGHMMALAEGYSEWLRPNAWGQPSELNALLPYWLGALAIQMCPDWMEAAFAVRIPFAMLLGLTLASTWHATYYLALAPQAQPVAFAFGGEAKPKDYARTIADGAVLALIACLGLALLSHEASPILVQLALMSLTFYGVAALHQHPRHSSVALCLGLIGLCLSGAPSLAVLLATGSGLLCFSESPSLRLRKVYGSGLIGLGLLVAVISYWLEIWHWRLLPIESSILEWRSHLRLLAWFTWPAWPLAIWTIWRWRRQWASMQWSRHLVLPMGFSILMICTAIFSRSSQQTLLLALPSLATLAAFSLPTMRRSVTALIDWFALLFFSFCALAIWVTWLAMQTGWPRVPAHNVLRLAPEFTPSLSLVALTVAIFASVLWAWLVYWRTSRHRHALWKSMVLPAGGAALCWVLLMTLWLPLLNFAFGYQAWAEKVSAEIKQQTRSSPENTCAMSYGLNVGQMAALHYYSQLDIHAIDIDKPSLLIDNCPWLLVEHDARQELRHKVNLQQWRHLRVIQRPSDKREALILYQRR